MAKHISYGKTFGLFYDTYRKFCRENSPNGKPNSETTDYYQQTQTGTTMALLSQDKISKFMYPLPSKKEQTAIANVLSSMDKEIEILNTKLEKYRNLKTAMMQQLLTGKIRLK